MKRFAIAAALTLTLLGTGNAVLAAPVVPLQTDELESGKFADANGWDPRWVDRQNGFYRMIKAGAGDTAYVMETVFTGGKLPANPDAKSAEHVPDSVRGEKDRLYRCHVLRGPLRERRGARDENLSRILGWRGSGFCRLCADRPEMLEVTGDPRPCLSVFHGYA